MRRRRFATAGRTVLLSSHILAEAETLCDRVSIIRRGRTVESGSLAELRHLTRTSVTADLTTAPHGLAQLDGVHNLVTERRDGLTRVSCEVDSDQLDGVLRRFADAGVRGLTSSPPTLEQLFLRHYTDETDTSEASTGAR